MPPANLTTSDHPRAMLRPGDCRVEDLARTVACATDPAACPGAGEIVRAVPIYDAAALRLQLQQAGSAAARREALMLEWVGVLQHGPGVFVLRGAFDDPAVVDATTAQFRALIDEQRSSAARGDRGAGGDHFAKPGANDRVWNALEKLCRRAPDVFAAYYANDMLALASEAWLGPAYQVTSQVNCVNPGGAAQMPHRDYHLGFFTPAGAAQYPAHVHALSPYLTLQAAVAHVDMPLESGPTLFLPHSQKYDAGYLVAERPDFKAFFEAHHVQLALRKGDALFLSPALLHAAGHNRSAQVRRIANLLQISSAFGRAMETVDRTQMCRHLYPALLDALDGGRLTMPAAERAIAACAEGYAFPTNLDLDPPIGGLAPESQQALMRRALGERWVPPDFDRALQEMAARQQRG